MARRVKMLFEKSGKPVKIYVAQPLGNVPCRLAEGEPLLQHAEDRLRHGLRPPGLEGSTFPEAQVVHQALVGVPALLPHGLQLVLVAVC